MERSKAWRRSTAAAAACAEPLHLGRTRAGQASAVHGNGGRTRSNPAIKAFYLRLPAGAKHAKPALTASMRKLLVILNAMLRSNTHWQTPALATSNSTISPVARAVADHGCS
jgi:hypothetical protein